MKKTTALLKRAYLLFLTLFMLFSCSKDEEKEQEKEPTSSSKNTCQITSLLYKDSNSPLDDKYSYNYDDLNRYVGFNITRDSKVIQDYRYSYLVNGNVDVEFWSYNAQTDQLEIIENNSHTINIIGDNLVNEITYEYQGSEQTDPSGNQELTTVFRKYTYSYNSDNRLTERNYITTTTGNISNYEYTSDQEKIKYTISEGNAIMIEEIGTDGVTENVRRTQINTFTDYPYFIEHTGPKYGIGDKNLLATSVFKDEDGIIDEENSYSYEFDEDGKIITQTVVCTYSSAIDRTKTTSYNYLCD